MSWQYLFGFTGIHLLPPILSKKCYQRPHMGHSFKALQFTESKAVCEPPGI